MPKGKGYSLEKDIESFDKKKKATAKYGAARQARMKKKAAAKPEENWATRLKRKVKMMLQGEKYKAPKKNSPKKNNPKRGGY